MLIRHHSRLSIDTCESLDLKIIISFMYYPHHHLVSVHINYQSVLTYTALPINRNYINYRKITFLEKRDRERSDEFITQIIVNFNNYFGHNCELHASHNCELHASIKPSSCHATNSTAYTLTSITIALFRDCLEKKKRMEPLQTTSIQSDQAPSMKHSKRGGWTTFPFIIGESFLSLISFG